MNKLIFGMTMLAPGAAVAGGYFIPNQTARDLAVSEAGVAAQDGAEAILLNIAALAGQVGLNVSVNGQILINQTEWSDPSLGEASLNTTPTFPPAIAISYGTRLRNDMGLGFGVGMSVAGGASLDWPAGWPGQEAIQSVDQQVIQFGVGGAIQPTPYLKLGVGFVRYEVVEELHQSVNYLSHYGDAGLAASGGGNTFSVGIEVKVPRVPLTLGAHYDHSADVTLDGDAHFTNVPTAFQPMLHDQGVTHAMTIPNELIVGAAYDVTPDVKVMAAYTFERWSVYTDDTLVGDDGFMVVVPRDYNNAHVFRLGGEWKNTPFLPALTLRAGGLRNISPQPSETISPSLSDADAWGVSVGAGYNVTRGLRIDLGYQHFFFDEVTASGDAFPGTYDSTADLISLGVNWRSDLGFLRGE